MVFTVKKLIVFEGIDNSGKTSISRRLLEVMNEDLAALLHHVGHDHAPADIKDLASSWEGQPWIWSKEPQFSTEEADLLNSDALPVSEAYREYKFLESRMRNQNVYQENNVILDRYLWTGLAYAKVFSPSCYEFVTHLYTNYNIFKKPDLVIFVDTPLQVCHEREPAVPVSRLEKIRSAYMDTKILVERVCPVVTISGEGNIEQNLEGAVDEVRKALVQWNSMRFMFLKDFPAH